MCFFLFFSVNNTSVAVFEASTSNMKLLENVPVKKKNNNIDSTVPIGIEAATF